VPNNPLGECTSILKYNTEFARVGHIIYSGKALCLAVIRKKIPLVKNTQNPTDGIGDGWKYLLRTVQKGE